MLVWRWCVLFGSSKLLLLTAKGVADRGEGLEGADELRWVIYKGEWNGVLLHSLILIACVSVPTPMDPIQGNFVGKAIRSGEGKGIRVRDGKSKGERASPGSGAV